MDVVTKFFIETCCNEHCHVLFAITEEHHTALVLNHNGFYCPNGHCQSYTGISDKDRIQKLSSEIESCKVRNMDKEKKLLEERKHVESLEKSVMSYRMLLAKEKKKKVKS